VIDVEDERPSIEFRRASFDRTQVVAAVEASDMPDKRRIDRWRA
jgi:hypothetical protein